MEVDKQPAQHKKEKRTAYTGGNNATAYVYKSFFICFFKRLFGLWGTSAASADDGGGLTFSDGWLKETDQQVLSFLIIPVQTPLRTVHPYAQPQWPLFVAHNAASASLWPCQRPFAMEYIISATQ